MQNYSTQGILATDRNGAELRNAIENGNVANLLGVERTGVASVLATNTQAQMVRDAIDRTGTAGILATDRGVDQLRNAVEVNGTAGVLSTTNNSTILRDAVERNATAGNLTTTNNANIIRDAVERNATAAILATNTNGQQNYSAITEARGQLRTAIDHSTAQMMSVIGLNHASDIENFKDGHVTAMTNVGDVKERMAQYAGAAKDDAWKVQNDIMKGEYVLSRQAGENWSAAQNRFAGVEKDIYRTEAVLSSKSDHHFAQGMHNLDKSTASIERQAGDYFAKSQVDLVKVENSLGRQSDHHFEKHSNRMNKFENRQFRDMTEHAERHQRDLLSTQALLLTRTDRAEANITLQASENAGKLALDMCKLENALGRQADANTAALALAAANNNAAMIKQLAECCCEIKETVGAAAQETDELINSQAQSAAAAELAALKTEKFILLNSRHNSSPKRYDSHNVIVRNRYDNEYEDSPRRSRHRSPSRTPSRR